MPQTVTIADIVLTGATNGTDRGGWNAPEQRTEEGFDYSSHVRSEDVEITVEAWVATEDVQDLEDLRYRREPFAASIGQLSFDKAKLLDLEKENQANRPLHERVTVTIKEITEARVESAEISIETEAGSMGSAAADTTPSLAQPEDSDGGNVEEETGGIVGTLSGVRESLGSVF